MTGRKSASAFFWILPEMNWSRTHIRWSLPLISPRPANCKKNQTLKYKCSHSYWRRGCRKLRVVFNRAPWRHNLDLTWPPKAHVLWRLAGSCCGVLRGRAMGRSCVTGGTALKGCLDSGPSLSASWLFWGKYMSSVTCPRTMRHYVATAQKQPG